MCYQQFITGFNQLMQSQTGQSRCCNIVGTMVFCTRSCSFLFTGMFTTFGIQFYSIHASCMAKYMLSIGDVAAGLQSRPMLTLVQGVPTLTSGALLHASCTWQRGHTLQGAVYGADDLSHDQEEATWCAQYPASLVKATLDAMLGL